MIRIPVVIIIACLSLFFGEIHAKKPHTALYGSIYLNSGDSIIADGDLRVGIPTNKKKLEVIENAYTKQSKVIRRLEPDSVDSAIIRVPSAPERPHTFRFVNGYGWCWQAEHSRFISVYCFAPKGYFFGGNGGLWMRGKSKLLLAKDGRVYNFGAPDKRIDKKMRAQLESLFADDPQTAEFIRTAKGRRDKILRSLVMYNPTNL